MADYIELDISALGALERGKIALLLAAMASYEWPADFGYPAILGFDTGDTRAYVRDFENRALVADHGALKRWYACPSCGRAGMIAEFERQGNRPVCCGQTLE